MVILDRIQPLGRNLPFKLTTLIGGLALLFLTLALFHSTSRVARLEERSAEFDIQLSKRAEDKDIVVTNEIMPAGDLYTRWGRTVCPKSSIRIYEGVAGGSFYEHSGGASNILCLPKDPIWPNVTGSQKGNSFIYGAEYEIKHDPSLGRNGLFSNKNSPTLQDHNVPCAVCQTIQSSPVMMLPARSRCYSGWLLEYSGFLMASNADYKGRTNYLCFDKDPEADPAGYKDDNGALFYQVHSACGSLPCPPYIDGKELTCAVCGKVPQ